MNLKISSVLKPTYHKFHIVDPSPWPLLTAFSVFAFVASLVLYMHRFKYGICIFPMAFFFIILNAGFWWRDVVREATFQGQHTSFVQRGLRLGMIIFILSEVMFFIVFFGLFFILV